MKAAFAKYTLNFIEPGGTSRGILYNKDTYFIKLWEENDPERYGIGECALFKGLSAEDDETYETKLRDLCKNISENKETDLSEYSSIMFGLETAILDFSNGCKRVCFSEDFANGKCRIPINGLVWMGSKDDMIKRIDKKIENGFRTIKIKVGAIDFSQELDVIKYIRQRYSSSDLTIRVDANGGFSPADALDKIGELSKFKIHSIEQPIKAGQWEEMSKLCSATPIPIALDEELIGISNPMVKLELLRTIHPHYIILKPSLMGGFEGSTDWLKMASQLNIGGWITSALESNIGLNAIVQWVATLQVKIPQGLGTGMLYSNNITSPLQQESDYLWSNPQHSWSIPQLKWIE